jgi:hypothetical protein
MHLGSNWSRRASVALASALLAALPACGEQCYIVPTTVQIVVDSYFVEAPGDVVFTAETALGLATCGPSPSEVTGYHWTLDGEALGDVGAGPFALHFDAPGTYVVEVRIEDDIGAELPSVGYASILVY